PNANAVKSDVYAATETLATDDASETGAPLLLDFENELLAEPNAPADETLAPLALAQPTSAIDADATPVADALPASSANSDVTSASDELALPILVFDAETENVENDAKAETTNATADVPLLALPGASPANDEPTPAVQPSVPNAAIPPKVALKPVVPKVAPSKKEEKPTPSAKPAKPAAPVWRAVVPPSPNAEKPTKTQTVAKPVAKTASVPDGKSATFRKPNIR
ncbi:MAG: hypothetical protein IKU86_06830, partial [Thermoguttaceae bacterium]|nr:hypothetical protein [Thermoguttaceae bacterium]